MRKLALFALAAVLTTSADAVSGTEKFAAVPVWIADHTTERNLTLGFRVKVDGAAASRLRYSASSIARVWLNGEFLCYGPARGPHGLDRVDEIPLAGLVKRGVNVLAFEVAGYNVESFYLIDEPSYLVAEVLDANGAVVAATGPGGDFEAMILSERVQKVPRFSYQRPFCEVYELKQGWSDWRIGGSRATVPLSAVQGSDWLVRTAPYPSYDMSRAFAPLRRGELVKRAPKKLHEGRSVTGEGNPKRGYSKPEVSIQPVYEIQHLAESSRAAASGDRQSLDGLSYVLYDHGFCDTGFLGARIVCRRPGRVYFHYDEVLVKDDIDVSRMGWQCVNTVVYDFLEPGVYEIETFEPQTFRYLKVMGDGFSGDVAGLFVRGYKNGCAGRASFASNDPAVNAVFSAARETFVQNAVDVLTDCPSRERAGWLCDSYFSARAERHLTGGNRVEKTFLENFVRAGKFEWMQDRFVPMCYPADSGLLPNWNLWLVVELEDYLLRTGDRTLVDEMRPKVEGIFASFQKYRNSDGLLEALPGWVFIEWSEANKLVKDVNYPSNMTYARALEVAGRLYGRSDWTEDAGRVRDCVRRQSWTGEWFCDNAVRQKDGTLKLSGKCTETCQYYAFFFGTADKASCPELWARLVNDFGPKRRKTKAHPDIYPSNAFIGNYLRLELLSRDGRAAQVLDEVKGYFSGMAAQTGTLWEHNRAAASCVHGFASHAAVSLYRDVLGVRNVDPVRRTVTIDVDPDLPLEFCSGKVPVSDSAEVEVRWRKTSSGVKVDHSVPDGWRVVSASDRPQVEERELRGDEELVLSFPQQDIQARWTPLAGHASLPWQRGRGRIVSSVSSEMPLFSLVSQADANRFTLACSELVAPVECTSYLKYENGSVFEVRVKAIGQKPDFRCKVRIDRRDIPFSAAVADAADWLRTFPANRSEPSPDSAYEPLWNSWYAYRTGVTARDMEREGDTALKYGIRTLVYDMGWDRPGALDSTSFRPCGDWRPDPKTFPDFAAHLARQHEKGLTCLMWFGYPLVGDQAKDFARLKRLCLPGKPDKRGCLTLDPSLRESRAFVGDALVRALKDYGADGFKIDFLQNFTAAGAKGTDVVALQEEVSRRLAAEKPDALVEYMSLYGGIAQHRFCTHVRATDCPGDSAFNRLQTANLRLYCGRRAVHSDMVTWDDAETPEKAALQIISVLHSVVQYGRSLASLTKDHARMLAHWTRFCRVHRETLLKGTFRPYGYMQGYPVLEMESRGERIIAVHAPGRIVDAGAADRPVVIVNGSGQKGLSVRLASDMTAEYANVFGEGCGRAALPAGLAELPVPESGLVVLTPKSESVSWRVTDCGADSWRLQTADDDGSFNDIGAVQAFDAFLGEKNGFHPMPPGKGRVERRADGGFRVLAEDGRVLTEGRVGRLPTGEMSFELSLEESESVFGGGCRLDALDKRGTAFELRATDGWNNPNTTYLPLPFFTTSRGLGVFVNTYSVLRTDVGRSSPGRWSFVAERDRTLDVYFFVGGTIPAALAGFRRIAGSEPLPDLRAGPVVCRHHRAKDFDTFEKIRSLYEAHVRAGVKPGALIIEPWPIKRAYADAGKRKELSAMHEYFRKETVPLLIWMANGDVLYPGACGYRDDFAVRCDVFTNGVLRSAGSTQVPAVCDNGRNPDAKGGFRHPLMLDITNPDAVAWYENVVLKFLCENGIFGAKIDFCELMPDDDAEYGPQKLKVRYHWKDPDVFRRAAVHHAYPAFFNALVHRAMKRLSGGRKDVFVFCRGGGIGCQRTPFYWTGDQVRTFPKLREQLRAVLNCRMSGMPFIATDMGGYQHGRHPFDSAEEERVFARAAGFTKYMTILQTHGNVANFFEMSPAVQAVYRDAVSSFRAFRGEIRTLAERWPQDSRACRVDDEFLVGDDRLVAPVLDDGQVRSVYLPEGEWQDELSGRRHRVDMRGSTVKVTATLAQTPTFRLVQRVCSTERKQQ